MGKQKKSRITLDDYIKNMKKGSHELGKGLLGFGFHAVHHMSRHSRRTYTEKDKHKGGGRVSKVELLDKYSLIICTMQHIYTIECKRFALLNGTNLIFTNTLKVPGNSMCWFSIVSIYVLYRVFSAHLRKSPINFSLKSATALIR